MKGTNAAMTTRTPMMPPTMALISTGLREGEAGNCELVDNADEEEVVVGVSSKLMNIH
jgi:hypothetical protein